MHKSGDPTYVKVTVWDGDQLTEVTRVAHDPKGDPSLPLAQCLSRVADTFNWVSLNEIAKAAEVVIQRRHRRQGEEAHGVDQ